MFRDTLLALAVLGASALAVLPASAQVNLIVNGSFENPAIVGGIQAIPAGGSLPGWTVGGQAVDLINVSSTWQPSHAAQFLDLSSTSAGSITQSVSTVIGNNYTLFFAMSGNPNDTDRLKTMRVDVTGLSSSTQNFDTTGFTPTNLGWSERSISFVATSATTTISFVSLETNSAGPMLDNTRLFDVSPAAAAPEPGTLALLGSGLFVTAGIRRRRARR